MRTQCSQWQDRRAVYLPDSYTLYLTHSSRTTNRRFTTIHNDLRSSVPWGRPVDFRALCSSPYSVLVSVIKTVLSARVTVLMRVSVQSVHVWTCRILSLSDVSRHSASIGTGKNGTSGLYCRLFRYWLTEITRILLQVLKYINEYWRV